MLYKYLDGYVPHNCDLLETVLVRVASLACRHTSGKSLLIYLFKKKHKMLL